MSSDDHNFTSTEVCAIINCNLYSSAIQAEKERCGSCWVRLQSDWKPDSALKRNRPKRREDQGEITRRCVCIDQLFLQCLLLEMSAPQKLPVASPPSCWQLFNSLMLKEAVLKDELRGTAGTDVT